MAPLTEPLAPLTRSFVSSRFVRTRTGIVRVPEGASPRAERAGLPAVEILSMHGRGPRDLWFLTSAQEVLHDDGERVVARHTKVCGWGEHGEGGIGTMLVRVVADRESVRVIGESRDPYSRLGTDLTATLTPRGTWKCQWDGLAPALTSSSGDHTWKLAHNLDSRACGLRAVDGACAPVPRWAPSFHEHVGDAVDAGVHTSALWMRGFDDGWLTHRDEEQRPWLLRYNGVAWSPVGVLDEDEVVLDLWADEEGHAWLLVRRGGQWGEPANEVVRADRRGLHPLALPASFGARLVRGTGPRDVWFAGSGGRAYQWDGEKLRQGEAPFDATDLWSSPGGEVWMVGGDRAAHTAPAPEAGR